MNKALILSVRPEHAYNILTGKKTLELRKSAPKGFKGWVYVYVTKGKPYIWANDIKKPFLDSRYNRLIDELPKHLLNGTIPFRFWFDEYPYQGDQMPLRILSCQHYDIFLRRYLGLHLAFHQRLNQ